MRFSSFQRRWAGVTLLVLVVWQLGGWVVDRALTEEAEYDFLAAQDSGQGLPVRVVRRTHGFFISGGHGWSIGDKRDEHELSCVHEGRALRWQGPGMPLVLRRMGDAFYLATFDREGRLDAWGFRCFVWEGGEWKALPTKLFPRSLARLNLTPGNWDSDSEAPMTEPRFRSSLLAHFWYCIDSGVPYREVRNMTVTEEFVRGFVEKMKEGAGR
ncbi:hypothetical protein [Prosthecobacter sp.]|uniref:hypothetical protein n=1 Tax=Prosthecobacter sp. TaxID=1965333 RepID=UPI003783E083